MKRTISLLMVFAMLLTSVAFAEGAAWQSGQFEGQAAGFGGNVSVEVTIEDGKITHVTATGADESSPDLGNDLTPLETQIIETQSAEIDGVAGATITSGAVKDALTSALAQASGEAPASAAVADGVYTATRESYQKEHVTVSVTIADGRIADVVIDEITDNPSTITDTPCALIPAAIVESQSYNVDGVTGATFTSNSIKGAVRDCLDQAGGSEAFSAPAEKAERVEGEDVQTDILVVGGGAAGMTAAMEAYNGDELGTPSGYKVMLIEKAGFLGGSTSVSGGGFYKYPDETGAYDDAWLEASQASDSAIIAQDMQDPFNADLQHAEFGAMKRTNELLDALGVENVLEPSMMVSFFTPPENGEEKKWAGSYYAKHINALLPDCGVDVRFNTAATELVQDEDGKVIGVKVEDKTSTYTIYSDKVILACGGFANNPALIEEYAPDFTQSLVFCEGTNTGDGFVMARNIGAAYVGDTMFAEIGVDNIIGIRPDYCWDFTFSIGQSMFVNPDGERFVDEGWTGYEKAREIAKIDGDLAWIIVDSNNPAQGAGTDSDIEAGYAFKADTLEELAEQIGVPADNLVATAQAYNDIIDGKAEDPIGGSVESKDRLDTAPYVALKVRPCMITSLVALKVDDQCHVLNEDGAIIENLFATGDLVLGNLLQVYNAGHGVGNAVYTGDIAATQAKAELSK